MPGVAYSVIATLPDVQTADEYVRWLEDGHVDAVVRGGAHSAMIVRIEDPATPIQVETRYVFATRDAFDRYVRDLAPALRSEGVRRFGPERGVRMERRVGVIS